MDSMTLAQRIDALTVDDLRARGSQKWADVPGSLGAWIAEMDFGLAPEIEEALTGAVSNAHTGYPSTSLWHDLSDATSAFVTGETGWEIEPGMVRGISEVIHALAMTIAHFTTPGSAVVMPTPAYMPFLDVPPAAGRELRQVPLTRDDDGWHLDLDALDRALDGAGLLIWVNPHNPVGKIYTRVETEAVIEIVARHPGLRVFSDEIHSPIVYPHSAPHIPYASVNEEGARQAITAVAASKMWNLAGLKCAQFVFSNPLDLAEWKRGVNRLSVPPSTPGMVASIAAYRHGQSWRRDVLDYLETNRRLVGEAFADIPGVSLRLPDATYLAFIDCRGLGLDESPQAYFRKDAKVTMTDGALCGEAGAGFVRLNFGLPRPVLQELLDRLVTSIDRLGR
jgi:cystathionine beta-lyase